MNVIGAIVGAIAAALIAAVAVALARARLGVESDDYRAFARNAPWAFVGIGILIGAVVGEFWGRH